MTFSTEILYPFAPQFKWQACVKYNIDCTGIYFSFGDVFHTSKNLKLSHTKQEFNQRVFKNWNCLSKHREWVVALSGSPANALQRVWCKLYVYSLHTDSLTYGLL
jgi:hypothetical protein